VIHHGDCIEVMATFEPESIDAIVTDPPYGLEFMGKAWDRLGDVGAVSHAGPTERDGSTVFGRQRIAFNGSQNRKCRTCDRWAYSGNPCVCDKPDFPSVQNAQARIMQDWHEAWAREAFRVAKPGAHLLAFGGTRTYHRLASAIEDAGWEVRDTLCWGYASGFPKSLDVSKAIDKAAQPNIETQRRIEAVGEVIRQHREAKGLTPQQVSEAVVGTPSGACWNWEHIQLPSLDKWPAIKATLGIPDRYDALLEGDRSRFIAAEREVIGAKDGITRPGFAGDIYGANGGERVVVDITAPATDLAREWQGWGTALKPAWEPIVLARKPLRGTVAGNVTEYGTGALNIDGCRIAHDVPPSDRMQRQHADTAGMNGLGESGYKADHEQPLFNAAGRWPANVILTDPIFDGDTPGVVGGGETSSGGTPPRRIAHDDGYGGGWTGNDHTDGIGGSSGTYSRFFLIPKAARTDREPVLGGLTGLPESVIDIAGQNTPEGRIGRGVNPEVPSRRNVHPTVKPTDLMRHLVRLVTPPGGVVLDPFLGSGTTAIAAEREGFQWVGIEREAEYVAIAEARLNGTQRGLGLVG
jgi:DNA modification methylase